MTGMRAYDHVPAMLFFKILSGYGSRSIISSVAIPVHVVISLSPSIPQPRSIWQIERPIQ